MIVQMMLAGFFFLLVIVTNIASERFGWVTFNELAPEIKLQKISDSPKKFKISVVLILLEHVSIIALAAMLFWAFSSNNFTLAIIWVVARPTEAVIQIYNKKNYWRLLDLARQYPASSGAEKDALIQSADGILKLKRSVFTFAQLLFSVGTLAYSILFVMHGVVPAIIGWFGIAAGAIYGFGNMMYVLNLRPKLCGVLEVC
ncbi:DUF4386 domain-containing protein [Chloroflexota bacterium]